MRCKKRGLFIIVLSIFLVVLTSYFATAVPGCFVFPGGDEDLYCNENNPDSDDTSQILINECASLAGCDLDQYFVETCAQATECQPVNFCNVDCQPHALGWCVFSSSGSENHGKIMGCQFGGAPRDYFG